jgi:predicted DNA-binding transcriptional regulator AlpA
MWVFHFMKAEIHTHNAAPRSIADTIESYGRMLTVKELAPLLGESPKTLYARVKRGAQPAILLGSAVKFDPYVTAEWLRSQSA